MSGWVALLRAVNVGGTGRLPISELRLICTAAGFTAVQTHLASGNVVFRALRGEDANAIQEALQSRLAAHAGRPVAVLVRTAAEMAAVLAANPFPDAAPDRTMAIFLDQPPPPDAVQKAVGQAGEEIRLGTREIYVHYPNGMGTSRLRIAAARDGTARKLNTVAALSRLAGAL